MLGYRKVLMVSWTEHRTKEYILEEQNKNESPPRYQKYKSGLLWQCHQDRLHFNGDHVWEDGLLTLQGDIKKEMDSWREGLIGLSMCDSTTTGET